MQRAINLIMAYVRTGGTRTMADFDDLAQRLLEAWDKVATKNGEGSKERQLNAVFVLGAITTGTESGFLLPRVQILLFDHADVGFKCGKQSLLGLG
ncbi:uncharacterized protein AKAW2_80542A [Aspergillus luchuensis]|uniref:Uncharacterized protein n=1 Tax=Aspergillus kawachii TaxID=1069201 RepID=A0A7R7WKM1_ASPKA|nr:uncharacterized protein AKAW2_80542A [Aspergillus luchuensis]BCS04741.1 hypothetical protein AKAW2_80542A [Aspergillus luchuensis]